VAPVEGGIVDVSSGGMRIRTGQDGLEEGAILKVWLPIPEVEVTVAVLTEVRWVKEEAPGNFYAGLRFIL